MSLNTNELEALRQKTISDLIKPLSISGLDVTGLKAKAEELWKTIIQLETAKYDLAERFKRQEYDVGIQLLSVFLFRTFNLPKWFSS